MTVIVYLANTKQDRPLRIILKSLGLIVLFVKAKTWTDTRGIIMTRNQMTAKIAIEIAIQAIESGNINVDLTWLNTDKLLKSLEEDMKPKKEWDKEH
jgi:hypothetical protein